MVPWVVFTTLNFLRNLPTGQVNYVVCPWKAFLTYWTHLEVTKKMKCSEYSTRASTIKLFTAVNLAVSK
jgi:hypothetical protein